MFLELRYEGELIRVAQSRPGVESCGRVKSIDDGDRLLADAEVVCLVPEAEQRVFLLQSLDPLLKLRRELGDGIITLLEVSLRLGIELGEVLFEASAELFEIFGHGGPFG